MSQGLTRNYLPAVRSGLPPQRSVRAAAGKGSLNVRQTASETAISTQVMPAETSGLPSFEDGAAAS
jgi:hypothetical protein